MEGRDFSFAVVNPGAERAAKVELARLVEARRPRGAPAEPPRPAYGRPGFVTWKGAVDDPAALEAGLIFIRLYARSLGRLQPGSAPLSDRVAPLLDGVSVDRLQVVARTEELAEVAERVLLAAEDTPALAPLVSGRRALEPGERVLDLVVVGPDEVWAGLHVQTAAGVPFLGTRLDLAPSDDAPSRAYGKLLEVLAWSGLEPRAGERAAEVGAAPGGAAWALLERGLFVVGIDPADMDGRVLVHPRFTHVPRSINVLAAEAMPRDLDWVLVDVNAPPKLALRSIELLLERSRRSLRGVIATLKLRDGRAEDDVWRAAGELTKLGFPDVRLRQLAQHHREVALVGLRR
jgi:23S rRNA (cytidine2498-2'-O)-methyltransferase